MSKIKIVFSYCFLLLVLFKQIKAQDSTWTINPSCDIVNRFIWRGSDLGSSPQIQPAITFSKNWFEAGFWGSTSVKGIEQYSELDIYLKTSVKGFSLTITDYYAPWCYQNQLSSDIRFFNFDKTSTSHIVEGTLEYTGEDKIPIHVLLGTFLYGNDLYNLNNTSDSTIWDKNRYSTYGELGFSFTFKEATLDLFCGFTPSASAFGNTMGIVNTGMQVSKEIAITERFVLPVQAAVIVNPQTSNAFIVFGIKL